MKVHINYKTIEKLASGTASAGELKRAEKHMLTCSKCREQAHTLSLVLQGRKSSVIPGEHVKNAIINEWHRIDHSTNTAKQHPSFFPWRMATGLAAVVLIAAAFYFTVFRTIPGGDTGNLALSYSSGEVYLNYSPISGSSRFQPDDIIRTGTRSTAALSLEGYSLYASGSSEILISGTDKERGLGFKLISGSLVSRSEGGIKYSFTCGSYVIAPTGTEFILQYLDNRLKIWVLHGGVSVKSDIVRMAVSAGYMWDSSDPDRVREVNPQIIESRIAEILSGDRPEDMQDGRTESAGKILKGTDLKGKRSKPLT